MRQVMKDFLSIAAAFMIFSMNAIAVPQSGVWLIGDGQHAYGGDIINIDAQDNKVFIIFAAGEVPNNTYFLFGHGTLHGDDLSVELVSSRDGSIKHVTGRFERSESGYLDFPEVGRRTLFHAQLNDYTSPQSWMGYWHFYNIAPNGRGVAMHRYFDKKLPATSNGAGIALDENGLFGCEYQRSGGAAGWTLCVELNSRGDLMSYYRLRRSIGQASGLYGSNTTSSEHNAGALKIYTPDQTRLFPLSLNNQFDYISHHIESYAATFDAGAK